MAEISIILPVLNEPHLPNLILDLEFQLKNTNYEILIITSDKSHGKSQPYIPLSPNIKYFTSYGDSLERAILLGFSVAQGRKIIVMDADGSHPPNLIPEMIQALDTNEMVVASRFTKSIDETQKMLDGLHIKHLKSKNATESKYLTTPSRYLTTYLFTKYAQLLGSTLTDPMSGYFGLQTQLLTKIRLKPYKWKIALEINNKLRPNTIELPYTFRNRKEGKSKSNWKIGLRLIWDILEGAL